MSLSGAVAAQFKQILVEKCSGPGLSGEKQYCLEAGWPEFDGRCVFHLFTAILGYVLIFTVSLGQLPLLFKILSCQSGRTYVSRRRACLLVVISSTNVAYAVHKHLPISTWGEAVLLMAQSVIIMNLMFVYHGRHRNAIGFMLLYIPVMVVLLWPLVSPEVIQTLKVINLPVAVCSKLQSLYKSHKQRRTLDQFSSASSLLLLNLGSSGRLLTAVVDTGDRLMAAGYWLDCLFDYTLTAQALHYKRKNTPAYRETKKLETGGGKKMKERGLGL